MPNKQVLRILRVSQARDVVCTKLADVFSCAPGVSCLGSTGAVRAFSLHGLGSP